MSNVEMIKRLYDRVFLSCPGVTKPVTISVKLLCLGAIQMHDTQSPTVKEIFAWATIFYDLVRFPDEKRATTENAFHMALKRGQLQDIPVFLEIGPRVSGGDRCWTFAPPLEYPQVAELPLHLLNSSSQSSIDGLGQDPQQT